MNDRRCGRVHRVHHERFSIIVEAQLQILWNTPEQIYSTDRLHNDVRHVACQNTLPDNSWIKLYVNIQVDRPGGLLITHLGLIPKRSIREEHFAATSKSLQQRDDELEIIITPEVDDSIKLSEVRKKASRVTDLSLRSSSGRCATDDQDAFQEISKEKNIEFNKELKYRKLPEKSCDATLLCGVLWCTWFVQRFQSERVAGSIPNDQRLFTPSARVRIRSLPVWQPTLNVN